MGRKLLGANEICEKIGVKKGWIAKQIWRISVGKARHESLPPMLKVGGRYACYLDELDAWLEARRVTP